MTKIINSHNFWNKNYPFQIIISSIKVLLTSPMVQMQILWDPIHRTAIIMDKKKKTIHKVTNNHLKTKIKMISTKILKFLTKNKLSFNKRKINNVEKSPGFQKDRLLHLKNKSKMKGNKPNHNSFNNTKNLSN